MSGDSSSMVANHRFPADSRSGSGRRTTAMISYGRDRVDGRRQRRGLHLRLRQCRAHVQCERHRGQGDSQAKFLTIRIHLRPIVALLVLRNGWSARGGASMIANDYRIPAGPDIVRKRLRRGPAMISINRSMDRACEGRAEVQCDQRRCQSGSWAEL